MLAAFDVGTLAQWVTVGGILFAAWIFWRGGGGGALATLETANRVLDKRVGDLEKQAKADAVTIAELRARTDVTAALAPMIDAMHAHERNAQARSERVLNVLQLIADHSGPDVEAHAREDTVARGE